MQVYQAWSAGHSGGDRVVEEHSTGITSPSIVVPLRGQGRAHSACVWRNLPQWLPNPAHMTCLQRTWIYPSSRDFFIPSMHSILQWTWHLFHICQLVICRPHFLFLCSHFPKLRHFVALHQRLFQCLPCRLFFLAQLLQLGIQLSCPRCQLPVHFPWS